MSDKVIGSAEVGRRLDVDPKTVIRWAKDGKIKGFKTPGGWWKFKESVVEDIINNGSNQ